MDRDAHVRAARRRQALDALESERHRETMLEAQLEETVAQIDGERVDENLYAQMTHEDVGLVRAALGLDIDVADDEELGDEELGPSGEFDADDLEEEVARLQDELASSQRLQAALERYVDLLSDPPAAS